MDQWRKISYSVYELKELVICWIPNSPTHKNKFQVD